LTTYLTLGIAMPKGNNLESVVRQATELGVRQIVPLFSDRTAIKAGTEIGQQKRDRWQRIAAETAELSLRSYVPEVCTPQDLHQWLSASSNLPPCPKYICVTHPDQPHLLQCLREDQAMNSDRLMVVTGCEGGWTEREEQWAIAHCFTPVSLGDRILSAVTAPVVALSIITAYLDAF
jgi:16S rRNA (uracil1498-N3)-methyltransferase